MLDVSLAMRRPGGGRVVIANSDGVALLSRYQSEDWQIVKASPNENVSAVCGKIQGYMEDFVTVPVVGVIHTDKQVMTGRKYARFDCIEGDYLWSSESITAAFGWLKGDATLKAKECKYKLKDETLRAGVVVQLCAGDRLAFLAPIVATPGRLYSWEKDWANSAVIEVK
jgi:hypothetical protein